MLSPALLVAICSLALALGALGAVAWTLVRDQPDALRALARDAQLVSDEALAVARRVEGNVQSQVEALETLVDQVERKRRSITAAAARAAGGQNAGTVGDIVQLPRAEQIAALRERGG